MGTYRNKKNDKVIVALQYLGNNIDEIWYVFGASYIYGPTEKNPDYLIIMPPNIGTEEVFVRVGEWITQGFKPHTFFKIEPIVFEANYEKIGD